MKILLQLGIQTDLALHISNTRKNSTPDQITQAWNPNITIIR